MFFCHFSINFFACRLILKQHQLLCLLWFIIHSRFSQQNLNITVLPFCDHQHSDRPLGRNGCGKAKLMSSGRVCAAANPSVDGELDHMVSVHQKEISELRGGPSLLLCLYWEVKKYQYPHKSIIHSSRTPAEPTPAAPACLYPGPVPWQSFLPCAPQRRSSGIVSRFDAQCNW